MTKWKIYYPFMDITGMDKRFLSKKLAGKEMGTFA